MRIIENANFKFIENRKIGYFISGTLILISIIGIIVRGIQYGIDFKGGKEIVIEFSQAAEAGVIREALTEALGTQPEVKNYGADNMILVRTDATSDNELLEATITKAIEAKLPGNSLSIQKNDNVTARFSEDLKISAFNAVVASFFMIFIYILVRFRNWRFSAGAVFALIHDVLITLGIFTLLEGFVPFSLAIDQTLIAAFLTIVGYSINDTVIVFDRIRENMAIHKGMDRIKLINRSINDTLPRTIITSATTLFVVVVLFIFGGEVLKGFSLAMILGIVIGTYSSIFIASSLAVDLEKKTVQTNVK